jgi:aspartate/methionine/tyrosine aminotransferase
MTITSPHPVDPGLLRPRCTMSLTDERFLMFVLDEMAAEQERDHDDVVRLTLGKSELPPDPPVVAAMLAAAGDYGRASLVHPAGLPVLRERLAEEYRRRYGVDLPAHRFVVGAGTSALIRSLMQLLTGPGDEVVVPLPYYPLYPFTARLAGATVRHYRIDPATMRIDLASLAEAVTERTRLVIVNSPGNPLGNVVDSAGLLAVDSVINGRAVLVSDEIYANVLFDGEPYSAVQLLPRLRCPLVVTDAFSKAHRMYARRVGYAVLPEDLVEPMTVVQHHTALTTDPVCQFGAIAALDHQEGVAELTARYRARRDYTLDRFAAVPGVRALPAQGSFYLTLDCAERLAATGETDTFELAKRLLRETRVATVPGADFGLPGTLRLSYSAARYEEAIDRMAEFFTATG